MELDRRFTTNRRRRHGVRLSGTHVQRQERLQQQAIDQVNLGIQYGAGNRRHQVRVRKHPACGACSGLCVKITPMAPDQLFVMIGQNRQAAFQQAKADHDFEAQELELKTNTELTRQIHVLTEELHRRFIGGPA